MSSISKKFDLLVSGKEYDKCDKMLELLADMSSTLNSESLPMFCEIVRSVNSSKTTFFNAVRGDVSQFSSLAPDKYSENPPQVLLGRLRACEEPECKTHFDLLKRHVSDRVSSFLLEAKNSQKLTILEHGVKVVSDICRQLQPEIVQSFDHLLNDCQSQIDEIKRKQEKLMSQTADADLIKDSVQMFKEAASNSDPAAMEFAKRHIAGRIAADCKKFRSDIAIKDLASLLAAFPDALTRWSEYFECLKTMPKPKFSLLPSALSFRLKGLGVFHTVLQDEESKKTQRRHSKRGGSAHHGEVEHES